jgi:hypothetical protein
MRHPDNGLEQITTYDKLAETAGSAMTTDVTRGEFDQLKDRVAVVEREVDGEKMVTRHILEQTRRNGDDLAAIKGRLDRLEPKLDGLERRLDSVARTVDGLGGNMSALEQKVGGLDRNVDGLTKSLPNMIADVMREVLRERDAKR